MKDNKVFFGENGLTSTSANHIANLAKEKIAMLENEISNVSLVNETVKLASSSEITELNRGTNRIELCDIPNKLNEIAKYKCLIAWLREAIKAKQELTNNITKVSTEEYCKNNDIELPEYPTKEHLLTVEEVIDSLPIKERNRYFTVETIASVYGKAIHPRGSFATARKRMQEIITKPNEIIGSGSDMTIYKYTPSVTEEDTEDLFFKLQGIYREAQAELNGLKHKIDTQVVNQNLEVETKYSDACKEYYNQVRAVDAALEAWRHEELDKISKLKIVIPDSLKDIYAKVSELGK